jgi:hypothetical protein
VPLGCPVALLDDLMHGDRRPLRRFAKVGGSRTARE